MINHAPQDHQDQLMRPVETCWDLTQNIVQNQMVQMVTIAVLSWAILLKVSGHEVALESSSHWGLTTTQLMSKQYVAIFASKRRKNQEQSWKHINICRSRDLFHIHFMWFVSHSFHVICFTFYHVVSGGEEKRLQHQLPPSSFLARAYYGTRFTPSTTNQSFSTSLGSHVWHNVWLFFVFIKQIAWCHKFGGVDIFWACKPRGCEWLLRSSSLPLKESSNSSGSVTSLTTSKNVILSFCDISL